jgi:hypothetical protein
VSKCFASDVTMEVTSDAVQLFGGAGYTQDIPGERMMCDAKITQICEAPTRSSASSCVGLYCAESHCTSGEYGMRQSVRRDALAAAGSPPNAPRSARYLSAPRP